MNAYEELFDNLPFEEVKKTIMADWEWAQIWYNIFTDSERIIATLRPNFKFSDIEPFLKTLSSINYSKGQDIRELNGFISYKDNTWAERHDYNGEEYWVYKKKPEFFEIEEKQ